MAKQKSRFPSYGLVRGPSHKHGGVAGVVAGEQPVELEGGEWIIPKEVVPDYLPVLKQITNEGRAIQQMENGNTAMDALIASASMETGLAKPKSPMYQTGGTVSSGTIRGAMPYKTHFEPTDGGYSVGSIYSVPASEVGGGEGLRYYLGEAQKRNPSLAKRTAGARALSKMVSAPQDSIPLSMLEGYFDQAAPEAAPEKGGLSFLKGLLKQKQGGPVYQEGGQVKPSIMDYLQQLQSNYGKYQGDVMTESGDLRFGPEGNITKAGYAEKYNFPLEEAVFDTLYDSGTLQGYNVKIPGKENINILAHHFGQTDKESEMASKAREIKDRMREDYEQSYMDLGQKIEGDASEAIDAVKAGYLDMDSMGRMRYSLEKSGVGKKRAKEDSARVSAEKQMMMKALGMSAEEYDAFQAMKARLGGKKQEQGGPIKQYGHGGQALPRKQQEMRNPTVYGPPIEMMGPMPTDTSAVDTTGNALQHMLNQLMMRDVNQNINPFTGDTIDTYLDSLRLKQRMDESMEDTTKKEVPWSPYRKKARQGGPVMYQEGGMVGQPQAMGPVPQGSLMGAANGDVRIRPLTPDTYITKLGEDGSSTMEIPKLSTAYLQSFGMETPLSKQQGASLHQKGITPDTLNPSVKGLINRVLVQRLANEDE